MDPDACFDRWMYAVARGDKEEACEAWYDLRDWLSRGGFYPSQANTNPEMWGHFTAYRPGPRPR